jgi:hypothetical protein
MMLPKNTILRLLAEGLKSGEIVAGDIDALLPKRKRRGPGGPSKVPKAIRERANELTFELGLRGDAMRLRAMKSGERYTLYLVELETNRTAGSGGEKFTDIADMRRAADVVVARYLEALV